MNPTPRTDALLVELAKVDLDGLTPAELAGEIGVPGDGEDLGPALAGIERLIVHAKQLEHELAAAAPTSAERFAACRAHVGALHTALKTARDDIASALAGGGEETKRRLREIDQALEFSEAHVWPMVEKARAVIAARDARSLARQNPEADHERLDDVERDFRAAIDELEKALP